MTSRRLLFVCFILGLLATTIRHVSAAETVPQKYIGGLFWSYPEDPSMVNAEGEERTGPLTFGSVTISATRTMDEVTITGKDKLGRPWSIIEGGPGTLGYTLVWTADLDGDGSQDLILNHVYRSSGKCTDKSGLSITLFDAEGRPSPWGLDSYFTVDYSFDQYRSEKGVRDLFDSDNNHRAEVVQTICFDYANANEDPLNFPIGQYGVIDGYEAENGIWRRLGARDLDAAETVFRRIVDLEYHRIVPFSRNGIFFPDHSNDWRTGTKAKIVSSERAARPCTYRSSKQYLDCRDQFNLEDYTTCYGNPFIVLKSSDETVAVGSSTERGQELLQQIISEKLPVILTGHTIDGQCSPVMIWASKP